MIIHDKLGKQAGEVVVFWLLRVMSQCGKVMHQQALIISQLKTLSSTGCRFSIVACFLCEVSDLNTPTCRRKHGIWFRLGGATHHYLNLFVTSETNPVTSLLMLFNKKISLKFIESFQRFHPEKWIPEKSTKLPFCSFTLRVTLELKIEEHVKNRFAGGKWNHNGLGFVNLSSKPKNVKHIIGSIIYKYVTTW